MLRLFIGWLPGWLLIHIILIRPAGGVGHRLLGPLLPGFVLLQPELTCEPLQLEHTTDIEGRGLPANGADVLPLPSLASGVVCVLFDCAVDAGVVQAGQHQHLRVGVLADYARVAVLHTKLTL